MKMLAERSREFTPVGLVRSQKSADKVKKTAGVSEDAIVTGDISNPAALAKLMEGCEALVVATSAVPKPVILSLVVAIFSKFAPWMEAKRPEFTFPEDGVPEKVDWEVGRG